MPLEVEVAFRAEAATEQRHDDAHLRLRDLENLRDAGPRGEGHLRRRPDRHPVAVPLRDDRSRLDRYPVRRVGEVASPDHDVRIGHRGIGIALDDRRVGDPVAVAAEGRRRLEALPVLVDERRVVSECRLDVTDGRQRLVLDLDQSDGLIRDLPGQGRDPGENVALEAHLLLREQPSVLDHCAVADVRHVLVRQHGEYSRQRPRLRRVDTHDPRVRVVGVAETGMHHAGESHVSRIAADSRHLLPSVRADEPRPSLLDRRRHRLGSFLAVPETESNQRDHVPHDHRRSDGSVRVS